MQENEAPEVARLLRDLFPPTLLAVATEDLSSFWTPQELAMARMMSIQRGLKAGWKLDSTGLLTKGGMQRKPTSLMPIAAPGDPGYNPRTDAFAVKCLGAEFVGPNRYRLVTAMGVLFVDRLGALLDPDACASCGGNKWRVRVEDRGEYEKGWNQKFTYCRKCVSGAELEMLRQQIADPNPRPR